MNEKFNCDCCDKEVTSILSSDSQALGCATTVNIDNKNIDNHYIICHYGSDYDTCKFLIKHQYINEFKNKNNICDECIASYLKKEYILQEMFYMILVSF